MMCSISNLVIRNYTLNDREVVFQISEQSGLERYDISELDTLYEDWKEGQFVAELDGKVVGFLAG